MQEPSGAHRVRRTAMAKGNSGPAYTALATKEFAMVTQSTTKIPINALWEKHLSTSFPPNLAGEEVDHMDLTLIDAATAGCIAEFLQNGGTLDLARTALLGLCHRHVAVVARELDGEGQEYFHRLEVLAYEVLQAIRDS